MKPSMKEAFLAGLEIALNTGIDRLHVYGDSQLIIGQVTGAFKVLKQELGKYYQMASTVSLWRDSHISCFLESLGLRMEKLMRSPG
jgi:ribonuclease HI